MGIYLLVSVWSGVPTSGVSGLLPRSGEARIQIRWARGQSWHLIIGCPYWFQPMKSTRSCGLGWVVLHVQEMRKKPFPHLHLHLRRGAPAYKIHFRGIGETDEGGKRYMSVPEGVFAIHVKTEKSFLSHKAHGCIES